MAVLGLCAAVVALLSEHFVYPGFSWNRDEPVYLWQSGLLRSGQLTLGDLGFPRVMQPWLSGHHQGAFFSQYPLGWPVVLLVGQVVGWPPLSLALAAVLAVTGTYALAWEITEDRRVAAIGALLLVASPILAVQSGVYLTYVFALGLGTWFVAQFHAGVRVGSRRRVMVAGILLGWMVMTRTFDAVMWAAAVGGFTLITRWRDWRRLLRLVPWFMAPLLAIVAVQLAHNFHLTGSPFEFPITVADPLDTFGFGERRLMPAMDVENYTLAKAFRGTAKNAFFLPWFVVGAYLGVAVAALAAVARRRNTDTRLLLAIVVAFPVGYFPFWGTSVSALASRLSGPIYFVPLYVPLCILIAQGLLILARRSVRAAAVVTVAMVVVTVPVGVRRIGLNRQLSRIQLALRESTQTIQGPAVVVVSPARYLFELNPAGGNTADLDAQILWATDSDPEVIDLIDSHPDRRAFVQRADVPTAELVPLESTKPYGVELVPAQIVRGQVLEIPVRVSTPGPPAVSIGLEIDGYVFWRDVAAEAAPNSTVHTTWRVAADEADAGNGGLPVPVGGNTIAVVVGFGSSPAEARANPSLRYEVLVQAGPTMRALIPGVAFKPDKGITDELVWRDAAAVAGFDVTVTARPGS